MTKKQIFYTRNGDDGTTAIYGQTERIPKYHPRPEAYSALIEFILPGDTVSGAYANLARTVIRRTERRVAELHHEEELSNTAILPYLNRLSSLLFVFTLSEDQQGGVKAPMYSKMLYQHKFDSAIGETKLKAV